MNALRWMYALIDSLMVDRPVTPAQHAHVVATARLTGRQLGRSFDNSAFEARKAEIHRLCHPTGTASMSLIDNVSQRRLT
jgi:hypothetical protein